MTNTPGRTHYAVGYVVLAYLVAAVMFLAWQEIFR